MADTPPIISDSTLPRKRPSYLWWLVVCDLALGLAWLVARVREVLSEGVEFDPSILVEALRFSFLGLTLFTATVWMLVKWFRPTRGAG